MIRKLVIQFVIPTVISVTIIFFALQSADGRVVSYMASAVNGATWHAPNWALLMIQPTVLQLHIAAAVLAFVIGVIQIIGVKGKTTHRILGWVWVGLMLITAISSFFIREINQGSFSFIHALSGWTVVTAPLVIYLARKHDVKAHRRAALGLFMGGLVIAGLFTFLPGRLMWQVFFG